MGEKVDVVSDKKHSIFNSDTSTEILNIFNSDPKHIHLILTVCVRERERKREREQNNRK